MKKILGYILSIVAFIFMFTVKVEAISYDGKLGYEYTSTSTSFYFFVEDDTVTKIELYIDEVPEAQIMLKDDSGIYYVQVEGDLKDKEYYYKICHESECLETIDLFANSINTQGDKNVILDNNKLQVEGFSDLTTIKTNEYNKSIYAIEANKFVENLNIETSTVEEAFVDSVFNRLMLSSRYSGTAIGLDYLTTLGMSYVEIGDLYDANNYFAPNTQYSSKTNNYSAIEELKKVILAYKNAKMNVIARTDFLNLSNELMNNLSMISSDYVVENKININNPMMQRYIQEVYEYWVNKYKIDGFYILNAQDYGKEYLTNLISSLKQLNGNLLIYTDSQEYSETYTSNDIQKALFGSLNDINKEGILNGEYSESNFDKLVQAMFSGNYNSDTKTNASQVINNFGSFSDLDLYSKIKIVEGLAAREEIILNKILLGMYTIFASAGVPRIISGNEFFNTNPIPSSQIESTTNEEMICNNSKTLCYAIGDKKGINWEYLSRNYSNVRVMNNYRNAYTYQYPSSYSIKNATRMDYNKDISKQGLLYLTIEYEAKYNGNPSKTILIINYSNNDIEVDPISNKDYDNVEALLGGVEGGNKTKIKSYTFYTFTEVKDKKLPNWAYLLLTVGLFGLIFGIRALLIWLLKTKKGIDYKEYSQQQKALKKNSKKKKVKVKEPGVFETFLFDDPIFNKNKKPDADSKEDNNEQVNENNIDDKLEEENTKDEVDADDKKK